MKFHLIPLILLFVLVTSCFAWSAPLMTYVAEFSVSGASNPVEIKTTLQTLLLSRLAGEKIATSAKPEGAEVKVTGSYLVSGSLFSLDATATNSAGIVIARAFTQGKSSDELIPAVGVLAKSLAEGIEKGARQAPASDTVVPADVIRAAPTVSAQGQVILRMAGALSGIAVGRTLPNGERELFMIGNQLLRYYRQGAELKLMFEVRYKVHEKVLAVDTADLDNDKIPEIYVTVMDNEKLVSQVLTVDGTSLKQIAGPLPYFFRSVVGTAGIKKLYAQQMSNTADFSGDVVEVSRAGDKMLFTNPVKLPKQGYLYNFNLLYGPKGEANPIIAERSGYLKLFNPAGDEFWKSSEEYSGSETHFSRSDLDSLRSSGNGSRRVFLDQRMVVKANGELLVAKNSGSWFLLNKHSYSRNSLHCFKWDGFDLQEKWHTRESDYYLADFAYDESSRELLLLEVVAKEEGIFDRGASRLVIRKID